MDGLQALAFAKGVCEYYSGCDASNVTEQQIEDNHNVKISWGKGECGMDAEGSFETLFSQLRQPGRDKITANLVRLAADPALQLAIFWQSHVISMTIDVHEQGCFVTVLHNCMCA